MSRLWESDDTRELLRDNGKDLFNLELEALIPPSGQQYGGVTQSGPPTSTKETTPFAGDLG